MSIIIKGIDLPKEGELHLIITNNGIICGAEYPKKIKHAYPLNLDAEAIQIPKGHGRLIDGDYAKYNLENYGDLPTKYLHMDLVREAIDDAPTILEAEEE